MDDKVTIMPYTPIDENGNKIIDFIENVPSKMFSNTSTDNNLNLIENLPLPDKESLLQSAKEYQESIFETIVKSRVLGFIMIFYGVKGNLSLIERGSLLALGSLNIYSNFIEDKK